jgi:hypothetical protein
MPSVIIKPTQTQDESVGETSLLSHGEVDQPTGEPGVEEGVGNDSRAVVGEDLVQGEPSDPEVDR